MCLRPQSSGVDDFTFHKLGSGISVEEDDEVRLAFDIFNREQTEEKRNEG
jgi:hypothetical protein